MKTRTFISLMVMAVLCIASAAAVAAERNGSARDGVAAYNPKMTYPGAYNPDVLMYRNPGAETWQRVIRLDHLRHVTCRDALEQLQKQGRWQGHLNPNGSCGSTAEPADWIMGNRLNYEDSLE